MLIQGGKEVEDFRLIDLCNSVCKIISKIMIHRVQNNLEKVVDENGPFLKNKVIHD